MTTMQHGFPLRRELSVRQAGSRRTLGVRPDRGPLLATGEKVIVRMVGALGPEWTVLAQQSARTSLILGPAGVFLIAPRWYVGRRVWVGADMFLVGGVKSDDVAVVREEATAAQERLSGAAGESVQVTGVIALLSEQRTIRSQPTAGDVLVMAPRGVPRHLQALATVLGPAERTRLLRACAS